MSDHPAESDIVERELYKVKDQKELVTTKPLYRAFKIAHTKRYPLARPSSTSTLEGFLSILSLFPTSRTILQLVLALLYSPTVVQSIVPIDDVRYASQRVLSSIQTNSEVLRSIHSRGSADSGLRTDEFRAENEESRAESQGQ